MSTADNKKLMQDIMAALANGDGRPFRDAMADDFVWIFPGRSVWSGAWRGKEAVRKELMAQLFAQFDGTYVNHATRFIAEGDYVVVECQGHVTTKNGEIYDNTYCYVCRFESGKLKELTEYMDTALAERVLAPPVHGPGWTA
jgi:uncharacterized protein (TIGR02246 family)